MRQPGGQQEEIAEEAALLQQEEYYDRAMALNIGSWGASRRYSRRGATPSRWARGREVIIKFVGLVAQQEDAAAPPSDPLDTRGIKHLADGMESAVGFSNSSDEAEDPLRESLLEVPFLQRHGEPSQNRRQEGGGPHLLWPAAQSSRFQPYAGAGSSVGSASVARPR